MQEGHSLGAAMRARSHLLIIICIFGIPTLTQGQGMPTASCASPHTIYERCRIEWKFPDSSRNAYWVQQFEPKSASWLNLDASPDGSTSRGSRDEPVEPAYLYRVLACDDALGAAGCMGSTMVWAPFIQPPEQEYLIPSRVAAINPERGPYIGAILKNADWLAQVVQYNVYQMVNAISFADVANLPDMTTAPNLIGAPSHDPIDQIQFNVYAAYLAEQEHAERQE